MELGTCSIQVFTRYTRAELKGYVRFRSRGILFVAAVATIPALLTAAMKLVRIVEGAELGETALFHFVWLSICLLILGGARGLFYSQARHREVTKLFPDGQRMGFGDEGFVVKNESAAMSGQSQMAYSVLQRVHETPSMFYLCINRHQAYLVSKEGFERGTPEEFRTLLGQKLPKEKLRLRATR